MKKGEITRNNIIRKSASVFNQKGYMTTSMNDIIQETSIQKGGIYRHFHNKNQLMLEAFQYSVEIMQKFLVESTVKHDTAKDKLCAFIDAFMELNEGKPLIGGCPIFNAAIEMDDVDEDTLLPSIREAMEAFIQFITDIVEKGIQTKEIASSRVAYDVAVFIISTLEGGIVLEKLRKDQKIKTVLTMNLKQYIALL
ncbi:TetR/AcrR family transcriptional regulator [Metasolibacillus meyeri]|uniref:TetR/AcrR family transcriptional regulator n=1 Tax=Metasolibacillus meyeri TaxID=1071052 RepID=A0AAW9NMF9_9BACL|nr:TetR/AcrR family transcriptional regulator [Metasolibacillus meyeri]MEC1177155.1 TetR/AcrR family transcriptional regulator [Metasolibacillus meyeri]